MEKWFVMRKGAPFQEIAEKFKIHPILARLIRNRDVVGDENIEKYLHGTIADLYDGMLMKDMDKAIDILLEKIREEKKIRIIGDYDIDGINATYILLEGLRFLGADVDIDIQYTGLRPGEKLYEELLMKEEGMQETDNKLIHIGKPIEMDDEKFLQQLERLEKACKEETDHMKDIVAEIVPTYKRKVEV